MFVIVIAAGRLGKDPDVKTTQGGTVVGKFSLACDVWKGKERGTEWVNVTCFGKTAELVAQYLKKGSAVLVQGRLETRKYEQEGVTKYFTSVVADRVAFLDRRGESGAEDDAPC